MCTSAVSCRRHCDMLLVIDIVAILIIVDLRPERRGCLYKIIAVILSVSERRARNELSRMFGVLALISENDKSRSIYRKLRRNLYPTYYYNLTSIKCALRRKTRKYCISFDTSKICADILIDSERIWCERMWKIVCPRVIGKVIFRSISTNMLPVEIEKESERERERNRERETNLETKF